VRGLLSQFGFNLALAAAVVVLSGAAASIVAVRRRREGRPRWPAVARVLTAGAVPLILVTTALPNGWPIRWVPGGDLVLEPGTGGLRTWATDLSEFPQTLASILLVANVALYVPLAFFAVIGWGGRYRGRILLGCLVLSLTVELVQYAGLEGVAATDDVLLNMLGAVSGYLLGFLFLRSAPADTAPRPRAGLPRT
jgi:hypothetical protein